MPHQVEKSVKSGKGHAKAYQYADYKTTNLRTAQSFLEDADLATQYRTNTSELKAWLLYYSLPILVKVLPEKYVVHFALLVEGIHILLSDDISPTDLDVAETILDKFYEDL
ncbi:hypothetical protein OS493_035249 [Desmophyllum pertusum]|uniref:Uncharacterized protein n=1 Tax=Desmophyllum pertusum TaxID=174260 RepID=A0A9X0D1M8_9CNID|nr:hypothetical protein OS493_035249 [Desmophyllum pertusum]